MPCAKPTHASGRKGALMSTHLSSSILIGSFVGSLQVVALLPRASFFNLFSHSRFARRAIRVPDYVALVTRRGYSSAHLCLGSKRCVEVRIQLNPPMPCAKPTYRHNLCYLSCCARAVSLRPFCSAVVCLACPDLKRPSPCPPPKTFCACEGPCGRCGEATSSGTSDVVGTRCVAYI